MYNLLSVLIGAFIAIMIPLNGILSEITGNYTSSVMIHIVGLIAIIIVLLISKSKLRIQQGIPLYLYSAGAIGVFTVLFSNISFTALGVSITIALGLLGQSVSSIIIDHFGLLGMKVVKFEKKKIIGLLLISSGIGVMTIF
ncbi:DMT family transporter [Bacillus sp. DX4.1]|uniref:DMT family transporter n=1 Tax=Bacillus sp. DX4.1 TaxID=3055867 RepID=UPI0025A2B83B|nr:DMT family transporter [Bacillus sp. DX4.1]MDM5189106.1 DMT family transporter [Bacillus sp. DX4.1]